MRPEVHEVTSTTEVTGEPMATGELMAAHPSAHVAAETAPVAAAFPASAGERGRRERET